jgi:molybdopterin converting factor small subunit
MKVEIRLYGSLRRYRPADATGEPHTPFSMVLPPGTTVKGLSDALGLPEGLDLAAVNDEAVDSATTLKDSDKIAFFPPSAGGAAGNQV